MRTWYQMIGVLMFLALLTNPILAQEGNAEFLNALRKKAPTQLSLEPILRLHTLSDSRLNNKFVIPDRIIRKRKN